MQNNLEERELDMHARKNVIAIKKKKKIASKLFVVLLLASVLIGILTVIPGEVRAATEEPSSNSFTVVKSKMDDKAITDAYFIDPITEEHIINPLIKSEYFKELTLAYPSSPQNLQSSPGDGYVVLSWDAPSSDGGSAITEYRIYRGTSYGKEVLLDSVTASRTSYKDTAVKNGQTYYYKVSAVNKEKEEGTSASTKATPTSSVTTPSAPLNFKASAGDGNVNLEWAEPSDDGGSLITNYNIYRGTTSGGETRLKTVSNVLSYTDDDVINNQKYYYQVSAVNSAGEGERSDGASATLIPGVSVPSAPRNIIATASDRVVNLNWNAPVDDGGSTITEYTIYRGTSSDAESYLYSVSAPTTSYIDSTVTNDQIYYYKVSAENSVGEGEKSNVVDARPKSSLTQTTAPLVTTPSAPLNFKASAADGYVNLEWAEPSDEGGSPITNYNIYRGTTSGGKTLLETVSNVLSYTDDDVINNQKYYYQVSAVNSAGEGNMSDEASATLIPGETVPSAPQDLNADRGDEYVDLSWNPPSNDGGSPITKYKVYRGMAPRGEEFLAEVDNAVNYRDYHVENDQRYYYQVSAVNLPGEGEKSNEIEVDVEPKGDTLGMGVWITIIVALIGALGVIAAALINYLSSKKTK